MRVLLLSLGLILPVSQAPPSTGAAEAVLLQRVAVVGASMSDGFGLKGEFGVDVNLADLLSAALDTNAEFRALGSSQLFLDPISRADSMLAEAAAFEPTLLVAVDFLFWFSYGFFQREESRLSLFERGLERLERFECPILVGTVPDMSLALEGTSLFGPMLRPGQVPDAKTLETLNTRLRAWAAERGHVYVVPLADVTARFLGEATIELRGNRWEAAKSDPLLQRDLLHPTLRGARAVTVLILDTLAGARPELGSGLFRWDEQAIDARLRADKAEELEQYARRQREREERRARRLKSRQD